MRPGPRHRRSRCALMPSSGIEGNVRRIRERRRGLQQLHAAVADSPVAGDPVHRAVGIEHRRVGGIHVHGSKLGIHQRSQTGSPGRVPPARTHGPRRAPPAPSRCPSTGRSAPRARCPPPLLRWCRSPRQQSPTQQCPLVSVYRVRYGSWASTRMKYEPAASVTFSHSCSLEMRRLEASTVPEASSTKMSASRFIERSPAPTSLDSLNENAK